MTRRFQNFTTLGGLFVLASLWGCFRYNGDDQEKGQATGSSLLQQLADSTTGEIQSDGEPPVSDGQSSPSEQSDETQAGDDPLSLPEQDSEDVGEQQSQQDSQSGGWNGSSNTGGDVVQEAAAPPQAWKGKMSAGRYNTCAVSTLGALHCWGPMTVIRTAFTAFSNLSSDQFHFVSVGETDACVIQMDHQLFCWGVQDAIVNVPDFVGSVQWVSVGKKHACALQKPSGFLRCWGSTDSNRFDGMPAGNIAFTKVAVGDRHACAIDAEEHIHCWGGNDNNQVDIVFDSFPVVDICAAEYHSCALRNDGMVFCWGDAMGRGEVVSSISFGSEEISCSFRNVCMKSKDGAVLCYMDPELISQTMQGETATHIASGWDHICFAKPDGAVGCVGDNDNQQFLDMPLGPLW